MKDEAPEKKDAATGDDPRPTPRRERQTLIPAFDPSALAKEIESAEVNPTIPPPFDPVSYARIVDAHVSVALRDTPRTLAAAAKAAPLDDDPSAFAGDGPESDRDPELESMGRAMYGSYLASDFPEALVLAERLLEREPGHALAQAVLQGCRERLGSGVAPRISPSSVVRVKTSPEELAGLVLDATSSFVLGHVDGVSDAATIAVLSGIPRAEAMDRLHALLDLDVVELVG
ncbi:MAG: hypothetical protein KF819_32985 [Labilithrix sp.]|nr:hypothetical protein [Labilithrix sp.]